MGKVTAKQVLRALRGVRGTERLMEASEQAIERKQINDALSALTKALSAGEKVRKTVVADLTSAHKDCERILDDIASTVERLMDSGRSGLDARVDALENFGEDVEDVEDKIETALSFLGSKLRRTSVGGRRGAKDATVGELRSDLADIKRDVKDAARDLRAAVKIINTASERLDYVADTDDDQLFAQFQDMVADDLNDAEYNTDELENAADRLE